MPRARPVNLRTCSSSGSGGGNPFAGASAGSNPFANYPGTSSIFGGGGSSGGGCAGGGCSGCGTCLGGDAEGVP